MTAPFIPLISEGAADVSNFQQEFTSMDLKETPTSNRYADYIAQNCQFTNFTYVHSEMQSAMDNAKKPSQAIDQFPRNDSV